MVAKSTSLCRGKSVKNPNRCKKLRGCKVAAGKKRTYCRKAHNKNRKTAKKVASPTSPRTRRYNRVQKELKKLKTSVRYPRRY